MVGKRKPSKREMAQSRTLQTTKDMPVIIEVREDNSEQIAEALVEAMASALEEVGLLAERYAKEKCPVYTGRLRNSITHTLDMHSVSGDVYVGTNVEYGKWVENGTSRQKPHPFLKPAATEHSSTYRSIFKRNLEKG